MLAVAVAGCGGGGSGEDAAPAQTSAGTSAETTPAGTFTNPVYDEDFPDPFVLAVDGTYYAYATNSSEANVQTLTSDDLVEWQPGEDALPELGTWAVGGKTWAPEVLQRDDGRFVLYYTANNLELAAQCIGRAVAESAAGPFVDDSKQPLVCQKDEGGSIDASPFRDDDGTLYLLWKNDGNCCGLPTYLYAQRLSPDGLSLTGKAARLVQEDEAWEGNLVEAPTLWREDGRLYLFFSANDYGSENYAVGYAECEAPVGPCTDSPDNPVLSTKCEAAGPGHQTLVRDDDGDTWIVYHAWPPEAIGSVFPGRVLWIDRVEWKDGKPVVRGPTCGPQERP